jgi:hypothetical protein
MFVDFLTERLTHVLPTMLIVECGIVDKAGSCSVVYFKHVYLWCFVMSSSTNDTSLIYWRPIKRSA